jgi:DNA gyrase/topoisomerase IV subunit A
VGEDVEEIVAISANGVVIRVPVRDIKFSHRQSQGATLMKVQPGDAVVALAPLSLSDEALVVSANGHPVSEEAEAILSAEPDEQDGDVGGGDTGQA